MRGAARKRRIRAELIGAPRRLRPLDRTARSADATAAQASPCLHGQLISGRRSTISLAAIHSAAMCLALRIALARLGKSPIAPANVLAA
jgi:hypothetical protein